MFGEYKGKRLTDPGHLRGHRRLQRRQDRRRGAARRSSAAPARARAPAAASSPPTRWPPPSRCSACRRWASTTCRRTDPRKEEIAFETGPAGDGRPAQGADAAPDHHARSRSTTRSPASWPPAAPPTRCCTCSPSPRRPASSSTIDEFDRISRKTPLLADLKPWGNYTAPEMYDAGGMAVVAKRLLDAGLLHANEKTVTGRTIGEEARAARETPGQKVIQRARRADQARGRHRDPARQPRARRLRGQGLRPEEGRAPRARAGLRARGGRLRRP